MAAIAKPCTRAADQEPLQQAAALWRWRPFLFCGYPSKDMRIDPAGYPFIGGALVPAGLAALAKRPRLATSLALLGGFFAYFFRDPDRTIPQAPGLVVAPADGKVMIAGPTDHRWAPEGEWQQVTIFLSPADVYINRTPVEGRITKIDRNMASPISTWLGGVFWSPIAWRRIDRTMMIRVKLVIMSRIDGRTVSRLIRINIWSDSDKGRPSPEIVSSARSIAPG